MVSLGIDVEPKHSIQSERRRVEQSKVKERKSALMGCALLLMINLLTFFILAFQCLFQDFQSLLVSDIIPEYRFSCLSLLTLLLMFSFINPFLSNLLKIMYLLIVVEGSLFKHLYTFVIRMTEGIQLFAT